MKSSTEVIKAYSRKNCFSQRSLPLISSLVFIIHLVCSFDAQAQSGKAFRDFDGNAVQTGAEPGVEGVVVRLFKNAQAPAKDLLVGSAITDANGNYNFATNLASGRAAFAGEKLRLEFDIPASFQCALEDLVDFTGYNGAGYGSSVQIITGQQANVNFPLNYPGQVVTNQNPDVFLPCYAFGNPGQGGDIDNEPAVVQYQYLTAGVPASHNGGQLGVPDPIKLATIAQVGSLYGEAFSRQAKKVFLGACLRRHSALGPLGPGGIYMIDPYTANPNKVTNFLNLDAIGIYTQNPNGVYPANPGNNTSPVSDYIGTNAERQLPANKHTPSTDYAAGDQIGKLSLGDVDISDDGRYLYFVNLYDRKIYEIDLVDPVNPQAPTAANKAQRVRSWDAPDPATNPQQGEHRPWGLKYYRGKLYVGVVLSGQDISGNVVCPVTGSGNSQIGTELRGYVFELNTTSGVFTTRLDFSFNYGRERPWIPWGYRQGFPSRYFSGTEREIAEPIIADIEFDDTGSMLIGVMDRKGHQYAINTNDYAGSFTDYEYASAGELLRANVTQTANSCVYNIVTRSGTADYYNDNLWHDESVQGPLAVLPGSNQAMAVWLDPIQIRSGGTIRLDNITGAQIAGSAYEITDDRFTLNAGNANEASPSKANALGDVELSGDPAPIEIGNLVWNDYDLDGIQDPNEPGIAGVTVELRAANGTLLATTMTDGNGRYYFNLSNVPDGNATTAGNQPGIQPYTAYRIAVPSSMFAPGQPLFNAIHTISNQNGNGLSDLSDDDAALVGANYEIALATGASGENNHSFDLGFNETVSVGSTVFIDNNNDGLLNNADTGIPGVAVELWSPGPDGVVGGGDDYQINVGPDGIFATADDVPGGMLTNAQGNYYFSNLVPGDYYVKVPAPNLAYPVSSTPPSPDPDNNLDNTDDGVQPFGAGTAATSGIFTLTYNGEPTNATTEPNGNLGATQDNAADAAGNMTIDFGFFACPNIPTFTGVLKECGTQPTPGGMSAVFTLSNANGQVTTGNPAGAVPAGYTVTYHDSYSAAQAGTPSLSNTYSSTTANIWVRITQNSTGCYAIDLLQLVVLNTPGVLATATNISCAGQSNGTATATIITGPTPYTYNWNGTPTGDGTPNITGLAGGAYTVTVTDGNGCTSTATTNVISPAAVTATIAGSTNVLCRGAATGTASVTAGGGTPPYSYLWSNGSASPTATGLSVTGNSTTYTVTVYDSNGCTATTSVAITQPATAVSINISNVNPTGCGTATGTATATATGGTSGGTYNYVWSDGVTQNNVASSSRNNLSIGTYGVTATDANGCTATATLTISGPTGAVQVNIMAQTNVSCFGGSNGTATAIAANGTAPYSFSWATSAGVSLGAATSANPNTVSGLAAGLYKVTVTDNVNCSAQTYVVISQPTLLTAAISNTTEPNCLNVNAGSISVIAQGGTTAYSYNWNGTPTGDGTATITGLAAGAYTVTITDANNCTATASATLTAPVCTPQIGVAKRNVQTALQADGTALVTFEFNIQNYGNVPLSNISLTDNLSAVFGAGCTPTVVSLTSDDFVVDPTFNGVGNTQLLLANTNTLPVGDKGAVLLTLRTPAACSGAPFGNTAVAAGAPPTGAPVTDNSVNGSDPNPTAGTPPTDDASPTPVTFVPNPQIGLAKRNVKTELLPSGAAQVTFEFNLENLGNVNLSNVQITDDLAAAFPASCQTSVMSITSDDYIVNAAFNGTGNNNLLLPNANSLSVGEKGAVLVTVMVSNCGNAQTSFTNTANGSGVAPNGTTVTDISDSGSEPDTDGDNVANEAGENDPTAVSFTPNAQVGLGKRLVQSALQADGSTILTFEFNVENLGNVNVSNLAIVDNLATAFPTTCVPTVLSITSDDYIVNPAYNGTGNNNLLGAGNTIQVGNKGAVLLTIRLSNCGAAQTSFNNTATLTGNAPNGSSVTDISDNSADPDTDGDNNPNEVGENDPTVVSISSNPQIGLAKRVVNSVLQPNGSTLVTFEFNLENLGNVNLDNVQITDNLATTFPSTCLPLVVGITSDDYLVNEAFNGIGDQNLLYPGGNDLPVGDKGAVLVTVAVFNCGAAQTGFTNTANATGTAPNGVSVTDISDSGSEPDTDGDNVANEVGENDPTVVTFSSNPQIGLAKRNVKTELLPNGSAQVTFEFNLENLGNVNLANVQITDDLAAAFPASCQTSVMNITSDDYIINPAFNGTSNQNLLLPNANVLQAGNKGAVLVTVMVSNCGNNQTGFTNTANASGLAPNGTTVTDISDSGSEPDANNNNNANEAGENDPTVVSFTPNAQVGLAKRLVQSTLQTDGSTIVTFEFNVENLGNVNVSNLAIVDNLAAAFPTTCVPTVLSLTSDDYIVNPAYNGTGNNNLLGSGNTIQVGNKGAVLLTIRVANCGAAQTGFTNTATLTGNAPNGSSVTDISDSGADPDTNDNGNPNEVGENDPTVVTFSSNPQIGLAKRNVKTELLPNGSAQVTFEFNLENLGNVNLANVQITDDLAAAFPASCQTSVMSITSDDYIINPAFNGTSNQNLLLPNANILQTGNKGAVLVTVMVSNCGNNQTGFTNTANASGLAPNGTTVTDISDSGSEPDANNNNNANEAGENDPTVVSFTPNAQVGLAKRLVQSTLQTDGSTIVTFEFNVENLGNVNVSNLAIVDNLAAVFPTTCVPTVLSLTSDDYIVNPAYNGTGNNNLLGSGNTIQVGNKGAVLLTIRVANCGAAQTGFTNTATLTGTAPNGSSVNDISDSGADPDPNDNGNPNEVGENDPTVVTFSSNPQIGLAKRNVKTELLPNGSAQVTFEFNLENLGNVNLANVQITDDLAAAFPASCQTSVMNITSDDYIINPAFNGTSNQNLLLPNANILQAGNKGAVLVTVMVSNCGNNQTGFTNTANASGLAPNGTTVTDISDSGSEPDTDGDNVANEAGENDPTVISFTPNAQVGLAKRLVQSTLQTDGSTIVTFEFNVENLGNVNVSNLAIADNLAAAFPTTCVPTILSLTSDDYIVNPAYNGTGNNNLLGAGNTIQVGNKGAVLLTIRVANCGAAQTGFTNTATLTGTAPNGSSVTDISDSGADPDPNDNGNPNEAGENDPTVVTFSSNPQIGLAKRNVKTELLPNGSAQVTFEFNLENLGNVNLANVQITDDLAAAFPASCQTSVMNITSDDYIINPAFNGTSNQNLLLPNANILQAGNKGAVLVTVMVSNCGNNQTGFTNTANASGLAPNGTTVTDISDSGSEPDTDGDNVANEAGENDPTVVSFTPNAQVGLAKRLVQSILQTDGSTIVTFEFNVENLGNVNVSNLAIVDNLAAAFPTTCVPTVLSITSDDYIVNPAYNGTGNNNLLGSGNTIQVGNKGAVLLTIRVANCGAAQTGFTNTATLTGTAPNGSSVTDISDSGADPDSNDNGNPNEVGENDPTVVTFSSNPQIGLAKRNVKTELLPNGSAQVTFEFNLENLGNVNLANVQITDDLAAAFPASCQTSVMNITSDDYIINPAFNGTSNQNLLLPNANILQAGNKGAVLVTVMVSNCGNNQTGFTNTANASGLAPNGTTVTDISDSGSEPDVDNNNNANEAGENDPTVVSFTPNAQVGLAKRLVQSTLQTDGSTVVTFEFNVENLGNVNVSNLAIVDNLAAAFPTTCVPTILSLTSDDYIVNPAYNGTGNNNLLGVGNTIQVGNKGAVLLTIRVANCGAAQTGFTNTATLTGTAPNGSSVTDISDSGADPDPNDNGNPNEVGENDPTVVTFSSNPQIGLAKRNVKTELLPNGSAQVTFEFNLENLGNVNLANVQITDDLAAAFPASCQTSVMSITSDDYIINAAFNGTSNQNLLLPNANILQAGNKGAVLVTVMVSNCGNNQTGFTNTANASGLAPNGTTVTDISDSGSEPDTDGDNVANETGENDPTVISFTPNAQVGLAKRLVQSTLQTDGSTIVTFEFNVENLGNVNVSNLAIADNLAAAFPTTCVPTVLSLTSDDYIVNPSYNGTGNNNLLGAGNTIQVGNKGAVLLTIRVANCGAAQTGFTNTATLTGTAPNGSSVTDISDSGADPDPNDNGNPNEAGENDPTVVTFSSNPQIGLAKRNVKTELLPNGSAQVTFEFNLENLGNVNLANVQITDDLAAAFPASCQTSVMNITSDDYIINPAFNGTSNQNLLLPNANILQAGNKGAVLVTVMVSNCGNNQTGFTNTANASGLAPNGTTVTDISDSGSEPDTDGDNVANETGENDPTVISFTPNAQVGLAKRLVQSTLQTDGSTVVTFEFNVENLGNVNVSNLAIVDNLAAAFPTTCVPTVLSLTSDDYIVNPAYNGTGNNNLLGSGNTIQVGNKGAVLLTIRVANCGAAQTSFANTATLTGTAPNGSSVTDISDSGADPDSNDNGNPNEVGENDPTVVTFSSNPQIGLAKRNVKTELLPNGSAQVTFEFNLENLGNVNLANVQITDDLAAAFPASCQTSVMNITSDDYIINPAFNGTSNQNLLLPNANVLQAGNKGAVLVTVMVSNCGNNQTGFTNIANASGLAPNGTTVTDISDSGSEPDTDGDNVANEAGENDPTVVSFTPNAQVGLAKRLVQSTLQTDGSTIVTFEFNVENLGNVNVSNLAIVDNLAAAFPTTCVPTVLSLTSDDYIVNPAYNGTGNNNLLGSGNTIQVGNKGAVLLTIRVANCGAAQTGFTNTATLTGTAPNGSSVTDISDSGADPDPNDNGNPNEAGENDPTVVTFSSNPQIGLAKRNVKTELLPNGSAQVTFEFNLENLGNVNLANVQITDDLAAAFPASCQTSVMNITSDDYIINPAFNGISNQNLLLPNANILQAGNKGAVLVTVMVSNCGNNQTGFTNTANASGLAPNGTTVTDISDSGSEPDANNNNNANEAGENDPTVVSFTPNAQVGLAKRLVQSTLQADGSTIVTFEFNVENLGNVNVSNLAIVDNLAAAFPTTCVPTILSLTSDDYIVNPAYNGTGNNNLLGSGNTIQVGNKGAVLLTIRVANCGAAQTGFTNTATLTGTAPNGSSVTDISDSGADPDPNDNGNPNEVGENDPTVVTFSSNPQIGLAKRNVKTELLPNGSAQVTFEFNLENLGNVNLANVQITDDLAAAFPASCQTSVMNITSDDYIINPAFNGTSNQNLLLPNANVLQAGNKGAVLVTVMVSNCGNNQTGFTNTANASGLAPNGTTVTDISDSGSEPDANNNNNANEAGENDPTVVSFTPNAQVGLAKRLVQSTLQTDGSTIVTFEFNVENLGNVNVSNLAIVDNLAAVFPTTCVPTVLSLTSDDYIVNPAYNGTGNNNLLGSGNTIQVGNKGAVLLTIRVANCGAAQTSFANTATLTGTAPNGSSVTDISDSGADPDTNDNGNPNEAGENDPTVINLTSNPVAGLAKRTVLVQTQPNGSANVTFEFNIKNLGNVDIKNIALIDNLTAAFPATCAISVVSLTSDDYVVNPSFTGTGNNNLLAPGNTLTVGNKGAVLLTINLLNCGAATQFNNTATLNGTAPNGSGVTDISDNGSEPDPDGDGNPNETGENDPTPIDINCILPQSYTVTLKTCALGQGMLMGDFNFTNLHAAELATTNTFNGPVPAGLVVTFHNSLEDANADQNPLTNVYNSQTANIWVRIERSNNSACYSIDVVHLIVNQVPILLLSKTDETCSASNDGTANVFVTNNQGAYNYDWSNLAGTNNPSAQTGLNGGVYTVTVTDGNGCISTGSVTVAEGPVLTLAPIPNIGPLCPGQKTIQPTLLSATPVNPATVYTWSGGAVAGLPNGTTTGLNPVIPGFNATTVEGVYTVTVTAALGALPNQCFTSTTFTITINDVTPPVFDNCPTSMVMIGNDPDQCSGKLNWSIPTATDECATFVGITQTGGPLSGSVISITCPPTPQTITYTANDGNGNTSTCTFQVMVVDTQKPEFDADIIMPNDTTVNCHQVPTNCVYHGPNVCTPLTKNDVHDNCTSPQNINIAYNEISTQNPNPAVCAHYTYDLTRTWTITDCAGNALLHTQKIHVQDTTKPVAVCKSITITLDKFGKASITPADVNNSSYDNCAGAPYLTYSVTPNQFTCANTGANTVTLKVTDPCGNFSTCTAVVTVVEGIAPCTPQYSVQTNCLDNATDENNGQFEEIITVKSLAMQTWTLNANSGLYAANSPAPPASPILIPAGTAFTAGTADGIDNDHDGQTDEADEMIFYTLRARFVECVGYSVSIGNTGNIGAAPAATTATIANKACYPNPYFLNLYDPFCLYTPPFTIQVGEYNNAVGNVINVMVDGVSTTIFDAAALGVGAHTVMATFDAGTATTNLVINGVQVGGSMADAIANPGCKQKITKVVNVVATPTTVVCNDLVYVSLDADCTEILNADDVLEGTYYCFDDYKVEIDKVLPFGNGPWTPGTVNASDIGKTYFYHVVHPISGNVCWGEIKVEDKLAPALTCPANITVACSESIGPDHTGNIGIQDCSATTTVIDDNVLDNGECGAPRQIITRTFIVTDAWGNQSTCVQTITVVPFDLGAVIFPADITVNCESAYLNPNATNPNTTGRPSINGAPIGQGTLCSASISYTDERYEICAGSYEILRTWKIRNTCLALSAGNPTVHTQIIRVKDFGGPVFACPPAVTVSTDPYQCCATAALPDMIVSEGCSQITNLEAKVTGANPANGNIITFTVPGHLADFAGNNYWNPDTLAVFTYTQCLPLGVYTVQYSAADQCGNTSKCAFQMTVADLVPPTAACDQFTQVDLGGDGTALVNASTFDDGSKDNCAPVEFKVRRMQPSGCQSDTAFYDQVKFCCSDINDTIQVVFRVYDVDVPTGEVGRESYEGHYNDCMVQVLVKDKIKPICNAPANTTVDCENFDPSLWAYGAATATDNCCIDTITHSVNYSQFDTVCNRGTLTRTFRAFDCGGLTSQCTQRVVVNYLQDYYIKFPNDAIVTTCDGTGNYGEPTFFGKDCELMGISFEDQIFTVVPDACFEIERTWKIINWCTFNPNLPLIAVPNPNPNVTSNSPQNLPGPIVSALGTAAPWTATVVKVLPTDASATNYATFWNGNANGYVYKQIIKITDTQDPTVENCPDSLVTYCDVTPNDPLLWNASYWWDNLTSQHDLCEGPADLTITATDACSGSNINIHYQLFLDLDADGTMETVVNSLSTGIAGGLPWNTVFYNNINAINYIGGTARTFDGRAVPNNQKYGFALQTTVQGNKRTASVRWNTQQNQNNFVVPELPYGKHKIKWFIEDGCGNESFCEYNFEVKDCKKPTVVCLNGLSVNIMPTQMVQLWASDFQQYAEDNCTPANLVKIGIRRSGTGTGFPQDNSGNPITSVNFTCDDLGTQQVELWGLDLAGNAGYCETYVIVQDNAGNCVSDPNMAKVAGVLTTEAGEGLEEGSVQITGSGNGVPSFSYTTMSNDQGAYHFNAVPKSSNAIVTPLKDDNPLNGVTTYDLALISRHILGIQALESPYKMIAADANRSNSITNFDIVELRKLILGIYSELPFNTSWRFIDKSFVFPNPLDPFQGQCPENKQIADIQANQTAEDFVAIKVGDVNGTAIANSFMEADDRAAGTLLFDVHSNAADITAGTTFTVTLTPDKLVQGYQFTLNINGLEVEDITGIKSDNYAVFKDAITFSVDGATAANALTLTLKATKSGKLSEMLGTSSRITKAEAYGISNHEQGISNVERYDIALRFNLNGVQTISGVGFELYQNQPNPFVDKTFIGFNIPNATSVTLTVYDETGRLLHTQKGEFPKGYNRFMLERALLNGAGILYYKVETATDSATKQMIQSE